MLYIDGVSKLAKPLVNLIAVPYTETVEQIALP